MRPERGKGHTFSFQSRRYESPVHLSDQEIQIRYDRQRDEEDPAIVVYHQGQRMGTARLLDTVANGMQRRKEQS
jgi:hypothetical protein